MLSVAQRRVESNIRIKTGVHSAVPDLDHGISGEPVLSVCSIEWDNFQASAR